MGHKRKKKSAFVAWLEYALLRTVCAIVNAIPYRMACAFAHGGAWVLVRCIGFKRKRTLDRIRSVFPDKTSKEALAIATSSLANILLNAVGEKDAYQKDLEQALAALAAFLVLRPEFRAMRGAADLLESREQ